MLPIIWIFTTIILFYVIKLIEDYRKWMRHFYNYPSYSLKFKDFMIIFRGADSVIQSWSNRIWFSQSHRIAKDQDYFVFWIGFVPLLFILNPNLIEGCLKVHHKKTIFMSLTSPSIQDGLFMIPGGKKWKKFRKISEINLRTKLLKLFFPIMTMHADTMVKKLYELGEDKWSDFNDEVGMATFNAICECAMGVSTESPKLESTALLLFRMAVILQKRVATRLTNPFLWPVFTWRKYIDYVTNMSAAYADELFRYVTKREITRQLTIKEGKELVDCNNNKGSPENSAKEIITDEDDLNLLKPNHLQNNFLSHLVDDFINQKPKEGEDLITTEEVEAEINNFILAGFETVRTGILWTLTCLACEPEMQKKIYDELIEVFGDVEEKWTFDLDRLNSLTYLDCCIKEGLRLFSPLQLLGRNSESLPFQLDKDHLLPTGTEYVISIYGAHHNETIYPNPEKFDPDRWSPERAKLIPSNYWIPFGIGPRSCVGNRFALYEMKIIIASIIKNFHLSTDCQIDQINWFLVLTSKPMDEIKFKVKPRVSRLKSTV